VQGRQVILQEQLLVLVERYRVGALVSGAAVQWVAASKVCDEMWVRKVLAEDEAAQRPELSASGEGVQFYALVQSTSIKRPFFCELKDLCLNIYFFLCAGQHKHQEVKNEWADEAMIWKGRRRVEFVYLQSALTQSVSGRVMLPGKPSYRPTFIGRQWKVSFLMWQRLPKWTNFLGALKTLPFECKATIQAGLSDWRMETGSCSWVHSTENRIVASFG
jgi:hypothetical protein